MPKSTTAANNVVRLIYNAVAWANMADNAASSPFTNLYISLHTADPGIGGSQTTSEAAYTNYTRIAVARTVGGWTVASGVASNAALIQFPQCGVTGATITHVAVGTASSGTGLVIHSGALDDSLAVANLIQPQFPIGALTATET